MVIKRYMERESGLLEPDIRIVIPEAKIGGFFRLQIRNGKTGTIRKDTGWFRNLITDFGMDLYGVGLPPGPGNPLPWTCCVGVGTAAPNVSNTTLQSPIAISGISSPSINSFVAGPPAYSFSIVNWAFGLGAVIGNISEVAAGTFSGPPNNITNYRCFSRQLILDGLGNPTTIAVTSSDQLNVSYQLRLYYDLTDSTTSVNISGTPYGGILRRATTGNTTPLALKQGNPGWGNTFSYINTGGIGLTSSSPGGSQLAFSSGSSGTYTPGSFTNTFQANWGTVSVGTIISGWAGSQSLGWWQYQLLPGFVKSISNTLSLTWSLTWARYP